MKHIILLFSFIAITFSACTKWDTFVQEEEDEALGYTKMDFTNLQVGDKFYFQIFNKTAFTIENPDPLGFEYGDKYLELEILEELPNNKFLFSEVVYSLKESEGGEEPIIPTYEASANKLFNYFQVGKDSLRIIPKDNSSELESNLFFDEYLSLENYRTEETDLIGFKPSRPFLDQDLKLFTVGSTIRGLQYDTLNIFMNNEPMASDHEGKTHIYDRNSGIVRSAFYGWAGGIGWDRIIDPF